MSSKDYVITWYKEWLIHFFVWLVILGMPLFIPSPSRPIVTYAQYLHFVLTVLSFMVMFYANYFSLIRKFLFKRRMWLFFGVNIAIIALLMLMIGLVSKYILTPPMETLPEPQMLMKLRFFIGNTSIYFLVICVSVAIRMTKEWFLTESNRKEMELNSLKSQINPHYLFNTLNNIYSLVQIDADRAQGAIYNLSRTLRYVIYESSKPSVKLSSEIEFLKETVSIMQMRLPKDVKVSFNWPKEEEVLDYTIAPMIFVSPIENAFKHGVGDKQSFIDIDLHLQGNKLVLNCRNSNFPKKDSGRSGSGIGIDNLKKRLELIYPGRHEFKYGVEDDVFSLFLEIEL